MGEIFYPCSIELQFEVQLDGVKMGVGRLYTCGQLVRKDAMV